MASHNAFARLVSNARQLGGILYALDRAHTVSVYVFDASVGYVFTLAGGFNFKLFGAVPLPQLIDKSALLASIAQFGHAATAYLIVAALVLHVALAIKRYVVDRDGFLRRMVSF